MFFHFLFVFVFENVASRYIELHIKVAAQPKEVSECVQHLKYLKMLNNYALYLVFKGIKVDVKPMRCTALVNWVTKINL